MDIPISININISYEKLCFNFYKILTIFENQNKMQTTLLLIQNEN